MNKIETIEQFTAIQPPFLLMKHSITCPISQRAWLEFERFAHDHPNVRAYYLHVQTARPLSNYVADTLQVKHESPQVLWITKGTVRWHASHWNITYDALKKATMSGS